MTLREVLAARRPDIAYLGKTSDDSLFLKLVEEIEKLHAELNSVKRFISTQFNYKEQV